jgi:hypothetical protein
MIPKEPTIGAEVTESEQMNQIQKTRIRADISLRDFDAVLPMTRRAQIAETLRN